MLNLARNPEDRFYHGLAELLVSLIENVCVKFNHLIFIIRMHLSFEAVPCPKWFIANWLLALSMSTFSHLFCVDFFQTVKSLNILSLMAILDAMHITPPNNSSLYQNLHSFIIKEYFY